MAQADNARVARELVDAFDANDMGKLDALIADDVVWHEIGSAEARRGKEALQATAPGASDYEITATVHDIVASDAHAIALVEATATRGGQSFTYRTAEIYHIRDGKVTERWAFSDDTGAITAFFA